MVKRHILLFLCIVAYSFLWSQANVRPIYVKGKVSSNGVGIHNVSVTDGQNLVLTDKNGNYTIQTNAMAQYVYISIPSGYKVPIENSAPKFYHKIGTETKQQLNFALEKLANNEDQHTLIVCADPQVYFEDELAVLQTSVDDMKNHMSEQQASSVYGLVVGDVVGYANQEPLFYDPIKSIFASSQIPFFYLLGNHDLKLEVGSNDRSKTIYLENFGPNYYSFNRGQIHYIMLDNCFYNGNTYYYTGYLDDKQLEWLTNDLATVAHGSTIVVGMHIPSQSIHTASNQLHLEKPTQVLQNRTYFYSLLEPYNAHIMSGHMHTNDNYAVKDNLFEHNHAALCALFYDADLCGDGTPRGYGVYQIDGSELSWYYKAVGETTSTQFKVYNVGEHHQKSESVVVNVWNYDPAWKVYWYEDGVKVGEMTQFIGEDTNIKKYIEENKTNFKHAWSSAGATEHLFCITPSAATKLGKVEVIDRFGNIYTQEIKVQ